MRVSYLWAGEVVREGGRVWSRLEEAVELEGDDGAGVETEGTGVLREVTQGVGGVEESHLQREMMQR